MQTKNVGLTKFCFFFLLSFVLKYYSNNSKNTDIPTHRQVSNSVLFNKKNIRNNQRKTDDS